LFDFSSDAAPDAVDYLNSFKPYDQVTIDSDDFKEGAVLGNVTQVREDDGVTVVEGIFAHVDIDGEPYFSTFYVSTDPTEGPELVFTCDVLIDRMLKEWTTTDPVFPVSIEIRS